MLRRADGHVTDLTKLPADGAQMRAIRGGEIGLVFQEPMSSLSAFHTIGNQLVEAIRLHPAIKARGKGAGNRVAGDGRHPPPVAACRRLFVRTVRGAAPAGDDRARACRPSRAS